MLIYLKQAMNAKENVSNLTEQVSIYFRILISAGIPMRPNQ
jgi:hypothetical protein